MNRVFGIITFLCFAALATGCNQTINTDIEREKYDVLFIGNSLSYTNDIPSIVSLIAQNNGMDVYTNCLCLPNNALFDHWYRDNSIKEALNERDYDFVIMQQGPSSQEQGRKLLLEYGSKIVDISGDSETVFYMVWPAYEHNFTYDEVIYSYRMASAETGSVLAPVGEIFRAYHKNENGLSLLAADKFHPSVKGAFFSAWIIYHSIFRDKSRAYRSGYERYILPSELDVLNTILSDYIAKVEKDQDHLKKQITHSKEKGNNQLFNFSDSRPYNSIVTQMKINSQIMTNQLN